MDILILKSLGNDGYELGVEGVARTSGVKQLLQVVAIEFSRAINDLFGVGGGGENLLGAKDVAQATTRALSATSRSARNIINNQGQTRYLRNSEKLSNLEFVKVTRGEDGYVVELNITTATGEVETLSI